MDNLKALFAKYMTDSCTSAEISLLMQNFAEVKNETELKHVIATELEKEAEDESGQGISDDRMLKIYGQLKTKLSTQKEDQVKVRTISYYVKYAAAAVILVAVAIGLYVNISNPSAPTNDLIAWRDSKDVNPGGNKATLTLADGTQISLNDAENGELAKQSGIKITKTKDGELIYEIAKVSHDVSPVFNTITTPLGGQYQVNLPDGTKVWLNAGSSLKYPTIFTGGKRKVTMEGEAYFEVAKDKTMPFIVQSNAQEVVVHGTHFNINSYKNENMIRTTLLEGSVSVSEHGHNRVMLKPGQQSIVNQAGIKVSEVDAELAVDWKNGNFYFTNENIRSIMRKLARWYDVEVEYRGTVPEMDFGGEISRSKKLSEILKLLETTGTIHFTMEGRRVIVMR